MPRPAQHRFRFAHGGLALAQGGAPDTSSIPLYQTGAQAQVPGVPLLSWRDLDPFAPGGGPMATMAEGGDPKAAMIRTLLQGRGGSGQPTQAPQSRAGSMPAIGNDVDGGLSSSNDPQFGALDPRSRVIARINQIIAQQTSLSGAQGASESIMGRHLPRSRYTLDQFAPSTMGAPRGYADGGEVDEGSKWPWLAGGAAAAAAVRPRYINRMARPFARALSKPVLGMESVSHMPLTGEQSDLRFEASRDLSEGRRGRVGELARRPVHRGPGAWQGERGMDFNPLYMQELPRSLGRVRDQSDALGYAAQMGENLEQAATPVSRFVPHLLNTSDDSNAMMVHGVDNAKLRRLAEVLGPDVVTAHRPGNRAMVFPTDDRPMREVGNEVNAAFNFPKIRYGRSDADIDRVLLAREPLGYESGLYRDHGALPRSKLYEQAERQAMSGERMREVFERIRSRDGAK